MSFYLTSLSQSNDFFGIKNNYSIMTDTFGKIMRDAVEGRDSTYVIERDDGFIRNTSGDAYVKPFEDWGWPEKEAMKNIKGPVLDVGCGVGRVGDYVKSQGLEYYGVDLSPLAVEMCHRRGHKNVFVMSADDIKLDRSDFRTVVLFGNNFGIMGQPEGVVKMLKGFHHLTTDDGVVLAGSIDPEATENERHLAYHAKNRAEGKPPGLVRLRNKYKGEVDDWWYLLLCGKELMAELAEDAGWYLEEITEGVVERENKEDTGYNVGILRKKRS